MSKRAAEGDSPAFSHQQQDALQRQINALSKTYGLPELKRQVFAFTEKLAAISMLNHAIRDESPSEEAYSHTVNEIISATQAYYNYIGALPEDLRQFFLLIANATDNEIHDLNEVFGEPVRLEASPLLAAQAIRPKSYIMQIDAITNQLVNLEEQTQLRVGGRGNKPVLTTVTLDMPDHMRIEGGGKLSTYDKSIINGVTSLLESGNTVFSIPMLYHAMTGKQNPTVDDNLYEELTAKLEKMRRMMLTIDLSEENEAHYFTDENGESVELRDLQIEGYLLPLNKVSGLINGKKAELYQIIQHPPLYSYSKIRRQLASVNISLLGAPVNNNATTIPLKTYLLQRVELMKNQHNNITKTNILYESVYQELGAAEANKTRKMRIRGYTTTILQYFVDQGYIAGYSEYKKGRSIAGVDIFLS